MAETTAKIKIVLQCGLAGNGFVGEKGDVIEWPEAEAQRMIRKGIARPYNEAEPVKIKR